MGFEMSALEKIKGAAPDQENAPSKTLPTKDTKESIILAILQSGESLNRFDAEARGDHVLPTTIAALRAKGFLIFDTWEWVPTRFGKEVHVKRYSYMGMLTRGGA